MYSNSFRFGNMWLDHQDFKVNIANWWSESDCNGQEGFKFRKKLQAI